MGQVIYLPCVARDHHHVLDLVMSTGYHPPRKICNNVPIFVFTCAYKKLIYSVDAFIIPVQYIAEGIYTTFQKLEITLNNCKANIICLNESLAI